MFALSCGQKGGKVCSHFHVVKKGYGVFALSCGQKGIESVRTFMWSKRGKECSHVHVVKKG